ncbi:MAG: glycosyltransferase family 2 protein [Myxococcota bacterium]|jgi:glycosyltransferase involved in cell wall biosynthesis|nr:glycosyltransferase family 2 protein [Myxococcota bacterium]
MLQANLTSILIPVYQREGQIGRCIDSALSQVDADVEVVVVDNASTDATFDICQTYAQRDPRVRVYRNPENLGPVRNWARCLEEARGEYAKLLFSDDILAPTFLQKTLPLFQTDVAFVFSAASIGATIEQGVIYYVPYVDSGLQSSASFIEGSLTADGSFPVSPSCGLFRTRDLRQNLKVELPGADRDDFADHGAGPDLMCFLLAARSHPLVGYVREALCFFCAHPGSITISRKPVVDAGYRAARKWFVSQARALDEAEEKTQSNRVEGMAEPVFEVSAIVSTYNSQTYFQGCLDDLLRQSLGRALEIVIIDSGSEQAEGEMAKAAMLSHPNVVYLRTEREFLYAAWNRAIRAARGKYLTIANTDDRHRRDALESMSAVLNAKPDIGLVYGDCLVTTVPNESLEQASTRGVMGFRYPEFFGPSSLLHFQFGPQFMWRRSLGLEFDPSFQAAGDYDFNCRFNQLATAVHIPQYLGLYLARNDAITRTGPMQRETQAVRERYQTKAVVERMYCQAGVPCDTPLQRAAIHVDMGVRALGYYPPWGGGQQHRDLGFAFESFSSATNEDPACIAAYLNIAIVSLCGGQSSAEQAWHLCKQLQELPGTHRVETLGHNLEVLEAVAQGKGRLEDLRIEPAGLPLPSQADLLRPKATTARFDFGRKDQRQRL